MASVFDVAGYIVTNRKETTAWQLQKLCYYAKAWSLALNNDPMFPEHFGAWKNGPVCRQLYNKHKGKRFITKSMFHYKRDALSNEEKAVIRAVLEKYGNLSGEELSEKTHSETPWQYERRGVPEGQNSNRNVKEAIMRDYYIQTKEDFEEMEDYMLLFLAEERENESAGTVSFKDAMNLFDITADDLLAVGDVNIE